MKITYFGDMLAAGGGCELPPIACFNCAWDKFQQLLSFFINRHLSLLIKGRIYCVRRAMLHAAEIWNVTVSTLNRLKQTTWP